LSRDGSVYCRGYHATPAVSEIAILLQSLLPQGTRAPGALRYTIARALLEVDVEPFDSIWEFSDSLARFERRNRADLIGGVIERWQNGVRNAGLAFPAALDRRRSALTSDLRRHLREADARLYQQALDAAALVANPAPTPPPRRFRFVPAVGACLSAGFLLIAAGDLMHGDQHARVSLPTLPPAPTAARATAARWGLQLPEPPAAPPTVARREIVKRPTKLMRPVESRTVRETLKRGRRGQERGPERTVLEKLRLQWLKSAFTGRDGPL
jgi:hypothetical protein